MTRQAAKAQRGILPVSSAGRYPGGPTHRGTEEGAAVTAVTPTRECKGMDPSYTGIRFGQTHNTGMLGPIAYKVGTNTEGGDTRRSPGR